MADKESTGPVDSRAYRNTIGQFATGVTIIGTGKTPPFHGMTANAITSLSLDPLLVLVCVDKNANCAREVVEEGGFSISILRDSQVDLSVYFADMWQRETPPPFKFSPWVGGPLLEGCIAAIGCELYEMVEGGDHWIVIGKVVALHQGETEDVEPLIYYRGQYRHLVDLSGS